MGSRHYSDYLLKEHEELLKLAAKIEGPLESASKTGYVEHLKALSELRSLDHALAGIVEHCHAGDRLIESAYYEDFRPKERARINADHLLIKQAVASFREELKFATADRTLALICPGMDLVKLLRDHVAFEGEVFKRIAEVVESRQRQSRDKCKTSGTSRKKALHGAKRRTKTKEASPLPYTLEAHPEL